MIKSIIKYSVYGAKWGCVIFVMMGIFVDVMSGGGLTSIDNFAANAIGAMVVGAGFSVSSLAYKAKSLVLWLKVVINVLVGFGIFFPIAFRLDWISVESPRGIVIFVAIVVIGFISFAFGDYLINGRDAKAINEKIKERELD